MLEVRLVPFLSYAFSVAQKGKRCKHFSYVFSFKSLLLVCKWVGRFSTCHCMQAAGRLVRCLLRRMDFLNVLKSICSCLRKRKQRASMRDACLTGFPYPVIAEPGQNIKKISPAFTTTVHKPPRRPHAILSKNLPIHLRTSAKSFKNLRYKAVSTNLQ